MYLYCQSLVPQNLFPLWVPLADPGIVERGRGHGAVELLESRYCFHAPLYIPYIFLVRVENMKNIL